MELGSILFEQYINLGAIAGTPNRYEQPSIITELEIVGVYKNNDSLLARSKDPHWGYSVNTIFVPRPLLPVADARYSDCHAAPHRRYVAAGFAARRWRDSP